MKTRDQLVEKQLLRVRDVIRLQHKAVSTENCYLGWLRRYFRYVFGLPRELPSEKKFEAFLTMLARELDVAEDTQNQAFNAILFFYRDVEKKQIGNVDALRATRPKHIRRAPKTTAGSPWRPMTRAGVGIPTASASRIIMVTSSRWPVSARCLTWSA